MLLYVVDANITYASHQIQAIYLRPHTASAIAVAERGRERDSNENRSNKEMEKSVRKTWNENENQTNPTKQIIYDKNVITGHIHTAQMHVNGSDLNLESQRPQPDAHRFFALLANIYILCGSAAYSRDPLILAYHQRF